MAFTLPTTNEVADRAGSEPVARARIRPARSAAELEVSLDSIRQARDMVIARNLDLSNKLAVSEDRVAELEYERDAADQARDAALQLVQDLSLQSDELREQMLVVSDENSQLQTAAREAAQNAEAAQPAVEDGKKIEVADSDQLRRELADALAMCGLMKGQHAKHAATISAQLTSAQRARDIAVSAVTNAQRQVERLAGERRELRQQVDANKAEFEARLAQLESQIQTAPRVAAVEQSPVLHSESEVADAPLCVVAEPAEDAVDVIRSRLEALVAEPGDTALLEEVDEQFQVTAASASGLGRAGVARFSAACGEFTRWLRKTPRKVESALPALQDAVALLGEMCASPHPERIADPAGALVYSVDDDGDNCECISMSLDKLALRTRYAMNPETALGELETAACDLIILDVDLPGMDGFELAQRIRAMDRHASTPIIFLSGLMSTRERLDSLTGGMQTFVPKPYNLNQLGVIVLGMILKSRLAKDAPAVSVRVS